MKYIGFRNILLGFCYGERTVWRKKLINRYLIHVKTPFCPVVSNLNTGYFTALMKWVARPRMRTRFMSSSQKVSGL